MTPETDILDVGSGPGTFTLPLSKLCKNVTSLDGAEGMYRELQKKADADKISNINVLHRLWEDVDIKEEGLAKQYDLVFASMTAAICDFDTLDKMNQASKKDCCLIFRAERSSSRARQDLWKVFFREEDSGYGGTSIIYPFNLLYSLGYFPDIQFIKSQWVQEDPVEDAIENLCRSFWLYTDITPEIKDTISNYVRENAVNNILRQETKARLGVVTWNTARIL